MFLYNTAYRTDGSKASGVASFCGALGVSGKFDRIGHWESQGQSKRTGARRRGL